MKTSIYIVSIFLIILTSCADLSKKTASENLNELGVFSTPINYDFDHLRLRLNASIDDSESKIEWRWDYMASDKSVPDTTGIDHYMNISQPVFSYNGESTQPSLFITTDRKIITQFSSIIIFRLENKEPQLLIDLFDSLSIFNLLKENKVRQALIEEKQYKAIFDNFEETIELIFAEDEYGYDKIIYEIKIAPPIKIDD